MSKNIKIGFIGAGGIGRHQIALLQKVGGADVIAAADVSKENLEKVKADNGVEHLFTDWRKLVAMKELDAISVCTPNKLHYKPTVAALNAGKDVLVEKPIAMNAKEATKMVEAARKNKKLLQIGFQWRFTPACQLLRKYIQNGDFGDIVYVRCQALRRRGIPSWGVFGQKELQGGGPMIDIGVHILEAAHYMIGSPKPLTATGSCYTYIGDKKPDVSCTWGDWDHKTYNVEDLAVGFIKFDNDTSLTIESSFAAHIPNNVFTIQIMGTKGGATMDPLKIFRDENGVMVDVEPNCLGDWNSFEFKMNHFVECVRDGKKSMSPGVDGLNVQKMLDAIYKSAEVNKQVAIK